MEGARKITPKYMMATTAIHKLGDISNTTPDLCRVVEEDDDNYYGMWVEGLGFFDVRFPKETTKELTEEDHRKFTGRKMAMSGQYMNTLDTKK